MNKTVWSMCGMCAVRCPIKVDVVDGKVAWIEGNANDGGMGQSLCAKGSAGIAFEYDHERPQAPMIRVGERGAGQWKTVSWDEAYSYIAEKMQAIIATHGAKAIALSDRGGSFCDLTKSFVQALGSPNYFNHDCTCGRNANHACKSIYGYGRDDIKYDFKNAKHIVLYGRNMAESFMVKEVRTLMDALGNGTKLTYIDPRASVTAGKASRYWQIRPGTDYALNLGIINTLIKESLYNADFVNQFVSGFAQLAEFIKPYTPEWAAAETGIPAEEIVAFCREVAADAPQVIFHGGWMTSRYSDSFYASRTAYLINVLLGSFEVQGGLFVGKGPGNADRKGLKALTDLMPKVSDPRCDGLGEETQLSHMDKGAGLLQLLFPCLQSGKPYPIKAYFAYRHDPLISMPDPEAQKKAYDNLDLLVAIDVNFSETAQYADVILPETTYLERDSIIMTLKGWKPAFGRRAKAIEPFYDSQPMWMIVKELLTRLGKGELFPFNTIEDIWNYQLQDTGVTIEDFEKTGFVNLSKEVIKWDRDGIKIKTPSGKIEILSSILEKAGIPSLAPYVSPQKPPEGSYRLLVGRCGYQAHGQSTNNPILSKLLGENVLWLNSGEAKKLGIKDGGMVSITNAGTTGTIRAKVTDWIHPEAVFMLHGFGRTNTMQTRAYGKGLADQAFENGLLTNWDKAGGGVNLLECFVRVNSAD
ncbi:MAG: molybdopterin-dependent oxidoreductase [Desulfobulbia bacterium]